MEDILDSGWLTNNGPYVQRFEQQVAELSGTEFGVAFSSATMALELLIQALGVSGEVIVPSFTFAATAHALVRQGLTPVFCDVDPETHCLAPAAVRKLIGARTRGVLGVHCWGNCCAVDELSALCAERGLALLFDAAHAFGCRSKGRPVGGFGEGEVFSFHATKFLHSFEGGVVTTNDSRLAAELRLLRNFGLSGQDDAVAIGTNGKMPEIAAAMGLTTLAAMDRVMAANQRNQERYAQEFAGMEGIAVMPLMEEEERNCQYVVLTVEEARAGLSRDQLRAVLVAENIMARRYFYPGCHRMTAYQGERYQRGADLRHTERLTEQVLVLPTGPQVTSADIALIAAVCQRAIRRRDEIIRAL